MSPLELFRRNQKYMMSGLILLAMFAFVVLPAISTSMQQGGPGVTDPVVAEFNGVSLTASRVAMFTRQHYSTVQFLQKLATETMRRGGQPAVPGFSYDSQNGVFRSVGINGQPSDEMSIRTLQFAAEAEKQGLELDDTAVELWLEQYTGGTISNRDLFALLRQQTNNRMGQFQLYDMLRKQLLSGLYFRSATASVANGQAPLQSPLDHWKNFLKLNQKATISAYGLLVSDYIGETDDNPPETDIMALYEEGKDRYASPNSSEPGFRKRDSATFEYLVADLETFRQAEIAKLPEEEIRAEYKRRTEVGDFVLPEIEEPPAEEEAAEEEAAEETPAEGETSEEGETAESPAPAEEEMKESAEEESAESAESEEPAETETEEPAETETEEPAEAESEEPAEAETEEPAEADGSDQSATAATRATRLVAMQSDASTETDQSDPTDPSDPDPTDQSNPTDPDPTDQSNPTDPDPTDQSNPSDPDPTDQPDPTDSEQPADEPAKPKFQPFEETRDQIARSMVENKARVALDQAVTRGRKLMQTYHSKLAIKAEDAERPNLEELAKELGLSYRKIGPHDAVSLENEPINQSVEAGTALSERGVPFAAMMFGVEGQITKQPLFRPVVTVDLQSQQTFLTWKTEETDAYTPDLEESRGEVIDAIRQIEARKLAEQAAEAMAEQANGGESLEEMVPEDKKDNWKTEIQPFSWLTAFGFGGIVPGNVPELDNVGEDFMEAVFTQTANRHVIAENVSGTVVYVIKREDLQPNEKDLKAIFKEPRERMMSMFMSDGSAGKVQQGFFDAVDEKTRFESVDLNE